MEPTPETFEHLDRMHSNLQTFLDGAEARAKDAERFEACPYGGVIEGCRCELRFEWSCLMCPAPDLKPGPFTSDRIDAFVKVLEETEAKHERETSCDRLRRRARVNQGLARLQCDVPKPMLREFLRTSANVVSAAGSVVWLGLKVVVVGSMLFGTAMIKGECIKGLVRGA